MPGLPASFEREGKTYDMEVTKSTPKCATDSSVPTFILPRRPENIRAGQTYHLNLQLGDPVQVILIPRGSFYQASGGLYVYVVDEDRDRRPPPSGEDRPPESAVSEVTEGVKPARK